MKYILYMVPSILFLTASHAHDHATNDHNIETEYFISPQHNILLPIRTNYMGVIIVKGDLIESGDEWADYSIDDVLKGVFTEKEIHIYFESISPKITLPQSAILILMSVGGVAYEAIGNEAWRGILPYSEEKWEELRNTPLDEISRTPPGKEFPLSDAIRLVQQAWSAKDEFGNDDLANCKYQAVRTNFGWYILLLHPTDDPREYMPMTIHYVSDEGVILSESTSHMDYPITIDD